MKHKFAFSYFFLAGILILTALFLCWSNLNFQQNEEDAQNIVILNEIEHLTHQGQSEKAVEKLTELKFDLQDNLIQKNNNLQIILFCAVSLTVMGTGFLYIYLKVLRPFQKLSEWAEKIAAGDLEIPLEFERTNYFGKFTWAFDSMRTEIKKARANEKDAVENNKTVIAALSHDIKTPIASIRAYSEALMANIDSTPEKRARYLSVLMKKCDEVTKLTNDLFLHSLSDMDKLKIHFEKFEICSFMQKIINDLSAEQSDIIFQEPDFTAEIQADQKRLVQITENIITNSRKYAETKIKIQILEENHYIDIIFRDFGKGIPDSDMPFIFDKFYRGKNCGDKDGSGLGLYIVKHLMDKMGGSVLLKNHTDGLEVILRWNKTGGDIP